MDGGDLDLGQCFRCFLHNHPLNRIDLFESLSAAHSAADVAGVQIAPCDGTKPNQGFLPLGRDSAARFVSSVPKGRQRAASAAAF